MEQLAPNKIRGYEVSYSRLYTARMLTIQTYVIISTMWVTMKHLHRWEYIDLIWRRSNRSRDCVTGSSWPERNSLTNCRWSRKADTDSGDIFLVINIGNIKTNYVLVMWHFSAGAGRYFSYSGRGRRQRTRNQRLCTMVSMPSIFARFELTGKSCPYGVHLFRRGKYQPGQVWTFCFLIIYMNVTNHLPVK